MDVLFRNNSPASPPRCIPLYPQRAAISEGDKRRRTTDLGPPPRARAAVRQDATPATAAAPAPFIVPPQLTDGTVGLQAYYRAFPRAAPAAHDPAHIPSGPPLIPRGPPQFGAPRPWYARRHAFPRGFLLGKRF